MKRVAAALMPVMLVAAALAANGHPERHASLPAVSPDGRHVAYLRSDSSGIAELRVVGTDGLSDRPLLKLDTDAVPGWGGGGTRVTIAEVGPDSTRVRSLSLDGRDPQTLAMLPAKGIAISHDGRIVAYASGTWRASILRVGDSEARSSRALTDSTSAWFNIAWSPDDRMLAATRMDSSGTLQVWLVNPADGKAHALTAFAPSDGRPQWPAWSPDGKRIAVQAGRYDRANPEKSAADIWVISVATGKAKRITNRPRPWLDETPSWMADNRHLVIQSSRTGRFELWRLTDDGKVAVQLTR